MINMKSIVLLFFCLGSISAHLKDNANRVYIGAALSPDHLSGDSQYNALAGSEFNCMTPENQMKWDAIEPNQGQYNYGPADTLVSFAQQHGMKIRGHTLIWHSQVPGWVNNLSGSTLQTTYRNHITSLVSHYAGKIYAWDVVNEVLNEDGTLRQSLWSNNFQQDFIADAFRTAAAADGSAKLYINDYNIEGQNAKSNGLYNLVSGLVQQGVPIHGVGFQTHVSAGQIPSDLQANLQRFAALGLDVALTEVDIKSNGNEQQQANDYASLIKSCEAVSRCVGVTLWGITDKYSWISGNAPLPWDDNYRAKPSVDTITSSMQ